MVAWAGRRGAPVEPALVAAALDHRHGVDGRLGHWTRAHVADALAVWFPRTVALLDDDRDAVPAALHALVGFLAERDWLDLASATPAELHAQIDDSTPALHDALADERNLDLGTFWAVQLRRHGMPAADPAAVARFLERVRRGEADVDREALAEVTRREAGPAGPDAEGRGGGPPARAAAERGRAARRGGRERGAGPAARRHPVGAHRPAADRGRAAAARRGPRARRGGAASTPSPPTSPGPRDDLPETSLLVAWARQARLVRVVRGRLVPVKGAAPLLGKPIELWHRAFTALGDLGEHFGGSNVFGAPSLFGMSLARPCRSCCSSSTPRVATRSRWSCSTGWSGRRSTSGSAASSTTSPATSSSGCGAATSPRWSTRWSCSAP